MNIVGVVDTPKIHARIFMVALQIPRVVLFLGEEEEVGLVIAALVLIQLLQYLLWIHQHLMSLLLLLLHLMGSCLVRRLRHFVSLWFF